MAVLTVSAVTRSGLNLTDALVPASAGGDSFANNGVECLAVSNGGASAITVTLVYAATFDGSAAANKTVSVGAGKTVIIGPMAQGLYNDANQRCNVTYSSAASVSVAVIRLG